MKKIKLFGTILPLMLLAACESSREIEVRQPDGKMKSQEVACVGLGKERHMKKGIEYEVSTGNVLIGVVFSEMVVPPLLVILDETYCPLADTTTVKK